jgi:hypothetical protein
VESAKARAQAALVFFCALFQPGRDSSPLSISVRIRFSHSNLRNRKFQEKAPPIGRPLATPAISRL